MGCLDRCRCLHVGWFGSTAVLGGEVTENLKALGHEPMPVLKAIRAYCLECSGGSPKEVRECSVKRCELYPFRMGSNPWRKKREISQKDREKLAARLAEARQ